MTLTLSAPSKTYLVGEYAVLAGGSALILNTRPRFELRVKPLSSAHAGDVEGASELGASSVKGIPEGSPAWRWLEARRPVLEGWQIEFVDPHLGQGGLGASGAQFLLVHTLTTYLQSAFARIVRGVNLTELWRDYRALTNGEGSGGDLLAQGTGRVSQIEMSTLATCALDWPYPELSWALVRTHRKIATHEHLRTLDESTLSLLKAPALACTEDFGRASPEVFLSSVRVFADRLRELGLQAETTRTLTRLLEGEPWCLLAKGCGALGADVVLYFYPTAERERATAFIRKQRLNLLATSADLTHGLELKCR